MDISEFQKMRKEVFAKRPVLEKILAEHGSKSLWNYAAGLKNEHAVDPKFKQELTAAMAEINPAAADQLEKNYFVFTADHMGPLCSPFFLSSNLAAAAAKKHPLVILATGNVSLGNSSVPQGLIYHLPNQIAFEKINFFTDKYRMAPVFGMPAFTAQSLARATKTISGRTKDLILEIHGSTEVLAAKSYSEQITASNQALWQKFFSASQQQLPDLNYVQLEDLVLLLLQKHHLFAETGINRLIFDAGLREKIISAFNGITAGFARSAERNKGTFMFWYVDANRKRHPLWPNGETLQTADQLFSIAFQPENFPALFKSKQLIPNTMLSLLLLSEYYGLKCVGGFSQVNYLQQMRQAYEQIFGAKNYPENHASTLMGDLLISMAKIKDQLVPATGFDLALYNNENSWSKFLENLQNMRLNDSVNLMMPELHKILYGPSADYPNTDQLLQILDLQNKIKPIIDLNRAEVFQ